MKLWLTFLQIIYLTQSKISDISMSVKIFLFDHFQTSGSPVQLTEHEVYSQHYSVPCPRQCSLQASPETASSWGPSDSSGKRPTFRAPLLSASQLQHEGPREVDTGKGYCTFLLHLIYNIAAIIILQRVLVIDMFCHYLQLAGNLLCDRCSLRPQSPSHA